MKMRTIRTSKRKQQKQQQQHSSFVNDHVDDVDDDDNEKNEIRKEICTVHTQLLEDEEDNMSSSDDDGNDNDDHHINNHTNTVRSDNNNRSIYDHCDNDNDTDKNRYCGPVSVDDFVVDNYDSIIIKSKQNSRTHNSIPLKDKNEKENKNDNNDDNDCNYYTNGPISVDAFVDIDSSNNHSNNNNKDETTIDSNKTKIMNGPVSVDEFIDDENNSNNYNDNISCTCTITQVVEKNQEEEQNQQQQEDKHDHKSEDEQQEDIQEQQEQLQLLSTIEMTEEDVQDYSYEMFVNNIYTYITTQQWEKLHQCLLLILHNNNTNNNEIVLCTYETIYSILFQPLLPTDTSTNHEIDNDTISEYENILLYMVCSYKIPVSISMILFDIILKYNMNKELVIIYFTSSDTKTNNTKITTTLLHCACEHIDSCTSSNNHKLAIPDFTIIKRLILLCGSCAFTTIFNSNGNTPLHILLGSQCFSSLVCSKLYNNKTTDTDTDTNTHRSVIMEHSIAIEMSIDDVVASIVLNDIDNSSSSSSSSTTSNKEAIVHTNTNGVSLLHIAIQNYCYECVLLRLITIYPHLIFIKDTNGLLPIHYVAKAVSSNNTNNNTSTGNSMSITTIPYPIVYKLVYAYPQSIYCQTVENGDTPIHILLATMSKRLPAVIESSSNERSCSLLDDSNNSISCHLDIDEDENKYIVDDTNRIVYIDRNTMKLIELLASDISNIENEYFCSKNHNNGTSRLDNDIVNHYKNHGKKMYTTTTTIASPLMIQNNKKQTPFHYCALYDTSTQIVQKLIEILQKQELQNKQSLVLLKECNTNSSKGNGSTTTDVHKIEKNYSNANKEEVSSVIYKILLLQDKTGSTALHLLLSSCTIYTKHTKDNIKFLSCHWTFSTTTASTITNRIQKQQQQYIGTVQDNNGYIPLHVAILNTNCTSSSIKVLLKYFPSTIRVMTIDIQEGLLLPLHLAIKTQNIHKSVIKELIKAYPKSVELSSTNDNTALHFAIQYKQSKSIIELLVQLYPESVLQQNNNDDETPYDIAKRLYKNRNRRQLNESNSCLSSSSSQSSKQQKKILSLLEETSMRFVTSTNLSTTKGNEYIESIDKSSELGRMQGYLTRISSRRQISS